MPISLVCPCFGGGGVDGVGGGGDKKREGRKREVFNRAAIYLIEAVE